jgi:hypothetical protein
MWLVLCDPNDQSALWAGLKLRQLGLMPVQFVAPAELALASTLEYRAENNAAAFGIAKLRERFIDTRQVRGTINRAARLECPQLRLASAADRAYVQAEMDATLLAWLGALPQPLFNPPATSGWSGITLHPFAWALHAQAVGFRTRSYRCGQQGLEYPHGTSADSAISTHLVFAGRTFPALPATLEQAAVQLAARVGVPLLGISLGWHKPENQGAQACFLEANSMPDLRVGGSDFIAALAQALLSGSNTAIAPKHTP